MLKVGIVSDLRMAAIGTALLATSCIGTQKYSTDSMTNNRHQTNEVISKGGADSLKAVNFTITDSSYKANISYWYAKFCDNKCEFPFSKYPFKEVEITKKYQNEFEKLAKLPMANLSKTTRDELMLQGKGYLPIWTTQKTDLNIHAEYSCPHTNAYFDFAGNKDAILFHGDGSYEYISGNVSHKIYGENGFRYSYDNRFNNKTDSDKISGHIKSFNENGWTEFYYETDSKGNKKLQKIIEVEWPQNAKDLMQKYHAL